MIISTRAHPPRLRQEVVRREGVLRVLDGCLDHRLTLISAPAGFGKSTLVAQWGRDLETAGGRGAKALFAWLSVDPTIDSGRSLFHCIVLSLAVAIDRESAGLEELARAEDAHPQAALGLLINVLARQGPEIVLAIDDVHLLTSDEAVGFLQDLIAHAPPHVHFLLTSRGETRLQLAALRARGEVLRISARQLRFTIEEAKSFLIACHRLELRDEDLQTLHARTEGWIAALQLAGLSIRESDHAEASIAALSSHSGDIAAFLVQDVLAKLPQDLGRFLCLTAHLDWFDTDLARAVTGRDDAEAMIARIEAADLFLIPLSATGTVFRYHHLFSETLRNLPMPAEERRALHLRAAGHLEERKLEIEAVHHALSAGALVKAAELVEACCMEAVQLGHITRLRAWLERLPANVPVSRPRLLLARAWVYFHSSEPRQALRDVRAARDLILGLSSDGRLTERQQADLVAEMRLLGVGAVSAADRSATATRMAAALLPKLPRTAHFLRGTLSNIKGFSEYSLGQLGPARLSCLQGRIEHEKAGAIFGMAYSDLILGLIEKAAGNLNAARDHFAGAAGMARDALGPGSYTEAMAAVFQAELAYERDDLAEAQRLLADHRGEMEAYGLVVHEMTVRLSAARLEAAQGRVSAAIDILAEAERSGARNNYRRLVGAALNDHVRLLLLSGDAQRARSLLEARGVRVDACDHAVPRSIAHEMEQLAVARFLVADGRPDLAHRRLLGIVETLQFSGRHRRLVQVQAVNARAAFLAGERIAALNAISIAMETAFRQGAVRSLLDEGEPLAEVIDWAAERIPSWQRDLALAAFVRSIRERLAPDGRRQEPAGRGATLSPKEAEVARALLQGASNKEIADRLGVSVDTAKWHLKNIYLKLAVNNRTQAVILLAELDQP